MTVYTLHVRLIDKITLQIVGREVHDDMHRLDDVYDTIADIVADNDCCLTYTILVNGIPTARGTRYSDGTSADEETVGYRF